MAFSRVPNVFVTPQVASVTVDQDMLRLAQQGDARCPYVKVVQCTMFLISLSLTRVVQVVIGGEGRAGKSSTQRSLMGLAFQKDHPITAGINIRAAVLEGDAVCDSSPLSSPFPHPSSPLIHTRRRFAKRRSGITSATEWWMR